MWINKVVVVVKGTFSSLAIEYIKLTIAKYNNMAKSIGNEASIVLDLIIVEPREWRQFAGVIPVRQNVWNYINRYHNFSLHQINNCRQITIVQKCLYTSYSIYN